MIKIGMTVADRYEVLEKIGTGGMSDVYRAKDHKLSRFVAVKVLKQEFSENKDFLQKFRSEAQSAAGLMHPNIVNVYDIIISIVEIVFIINAFIYPGIYGKMINVPFYINYKTSMSSTK